MQRAQVQSLVGELRSYVPHSAEKKKKRPLKVPMRKVTESEVDFKMTLCRSVEGLLGKLVASGVRIKEERRASLVAQWLRVCLPVQGTRVRALVWEDPTCRGATGPVSHNY